MIHFKQSPINIDTNELMPLDRTASFHYELETFHVCDNGQNISLTPLDAKSYVLKNNHKFYITEMHFHRPSEHHVDDIEFDMEVHIVHQLEHETLVYSVLLNITDDGLHFGAPFSNLNADIDVDLSALVPNNCWDYHGSFTTSPFDETVIWLINQVQLEINRDQANLLNSFYPANNRCLQPVGQRRVYSIATTSH
ncbi:carbonic anhydrase family protein [Mollicutes bacterium LVI A0039]|nr:carbonic anhydrase family protein [Mollicutes bacterium LVI A0039]